tara:strand:- start:70 stop:258 length:189 start_codon:yes stop_codon:yes gene_type:complete
MYIRRLLTDNSLIGYKKFFNKGFEKGVGGFGKGVGGFGKTGKLENWKIGKLENWEIGNVWLY